MAIQQQTIDLEDAIDLREIKNVKLANQLLKLRRQKKQAKDREIQQANIEAQTRANIQTQEAAAQAEMNKNTVIKDSERALEAVKADLESQRMQQEVMHKKELMALEFNYNMQLKGMETESKKNIEKEKEDRKDERTRIQATQQSEMIEQRNMDKPPKNFESAGNDIMGGGFGLGAFEPK